MTPAFVDSHVHTTDTGLALTSLDLASIRSAAQLLDAVAAAADRLPRSAVVLGHGWDESTWPDPTLPDAAALDRAAGGRMVYLSQASVHSALCSTALLHAIPAAVAAPGYHSSGWLRRDAHHAARAVAFGTPRRRPPRRRTASSPAPGCGRRHRGGPRMRRPRHLQRRRLHLGTGPLW